jgi:cytochrome c oxidase cbb3-type subunit 1
LTYSFVESVKASYPFYAIRLLGGICYLGGMLLMAYNVYKTLYREHFIDAPIPANVQAAH